MSVEIKVPSAGESISEVYIGPWRKAPGERVEKGDVLVELETDKATLELPAPVAGVLKEILAAEGDSVQVGDVIAMMEEGAAQAAEPAQADSPAQAAAQELQEAPVTPAQSAPQPTPSARRLLTSHGLDPEAVARGAKGAARLTRDDVMAHLERSAAQQEVQDRSLRPGPVSGGGQGAADRGTRESPMSPIRLRIAERLVDAQHQAALLTTFNEIDMTRVVELRREVQEAFTAKHGVKLGFMSFFVKAAVTALKEFPELNAQIVDNERGGKSIRYHNYCDVGIAVGGGKGLVVPVLRNAEAMSFAEIERSIKDFAERAQKNKIGLDELEGGTFTISNGGVYGSLLSTPIVNPPQSGILGLHAIQDRPVAKDGQVVIAKMMYIALTYDHRIVDGREAVTFLRRIKDCVERPERMLLDV